jgi:hypothetical protein
MENELRFCICNVGAPESIPSFKWSLFSFVDHCLFDLFFWPMFNEDGLMDQSVAELMAKLKEDIIL